jgi:hypothetical protein
VNAPPSRPSFARPARSASSAGLFLEGGRVNPKSVSVGVFGSLVLNLLFLLLLLGLGPGQGAAVKPASLTPDRDFDIELAPDEPAMAVQPAKHELGQFVETNPNAPENTPDDTANFGARNQQAANESLPEELSPDHTPAREGEKDLPFDKAILGNLDQDIVVAPMPGGAEAAPTPPPAPPKAQAPLPGTEENTGDSEDGAGSSIAEAAPHPAPVGRRVEGAENGQADLLVPPEMLASGQGRPAPAPRPRLPRVTPGPVKEQPLGVSHVGQVAVDCNFSEYGEYLARFVEAVSQRWTALCASRSYAERHTFVFLEFKLDRDGNIEDMQTEDTTAQALGVLLCRSAVEGGAPYGAWSKDMIDTLGEEQTIRFRFYYW